MTGEEKSLIKNWGQVDKSIKDYLRRRKIIILSTIAGAFLIIVLLALNSTTDFFFKPVASLNSNPQTGDWAMFGRDPNHAPVIEPVSALPQGQVTAIFSVNGEICTSPVLAQGIIYFGSSDHRLYALDAATGSKLWEFKTGSWICSSPAVVKGTVYFGSNDGKLYALDARTGLKLWEFKTSYAVISSPAVADDNVYFGANDFSIYALKAKTGRQVWKIDTENNVTSSPVVINGILCVGSEDEYFYIVDALHGTLRNRFNATDSVTVSPAAKDGTVYFCNGKGTLYVLDIKARNWPGENRILPHWWTLFFYGTAPRPPDKSGYLWSIPLNNISVSSPSIDDNNLYIGAGKKVISINLVSHTKRWEYVTGGDVKSTPVLASGMLYSVSSNGHLYILNAGSGELVKDIPVGSKTVSNPLVYGATVYISSSEGKIYMVK
jgi:eukaryotic-like serine/threonine-protein kinase